MRMRHWLSSIGLIPRRPAVPGDLTTFVEERHPGCVATVSGRLFSVINPQAELIDIGEIAHHLAQINRFGGACRFPYSVASHCRYCVAECLYRYPGRYDLALCCLLHDGAEAYCGDVVRGIKTLIASCYERIEHPVQQAVWRRFGITLTADGKRVIKEIDLAVLRAEAQQLVAGSERWNWGSIRHASCCEITCPQTWEQARDGFLFMFRRLWLLTHGQPYPEAQIWRPHVQIAS